MCVCIALQSWIKNEQRREHDLDGLYVSYCTFGGFIFVFFEGFLLSVWLLKIRERFFFFLLCTILFCAQDGVRESQALL